MRPLNCFKVALLFILVTVHAQGQAPGIMSYQGRVTVGGTNFNGTGQFKFSLVNGAGATTYWSNGINAVSLPVNKGLYSVMLGDVAIPNMTNSISPEVFFNSDVRLRISFNDGVAGFQQLSPDQRIASAGYALVSTYAMWASAVEGMESTVRGSVHSDGTVMSGSGFSVSVLPAGSGGSSVGSFAVTNGITTITTSGGSTAGISYGKMIRVGNGLYQVMNKTASTVTLDRNYAGGTGTSLVSTGTTTSARYTVTFDTPFLTPPTVVASFVGATTPTPGEIGDSKRVIEVAPPYPETESFKVLTALELYHYNDLTNLGIAGHSFSFIAIGPQ